MLDPVKDTKRMLRFTIFCRLCSYKFIHNFVICELHMSYCNENSLKLNPSKCEHLRITFKKINNCL